MGDPASGTKAAKNRTATVTIDAPASVVFAIVSDPRQHARIDGSGAVKEATSGPDRLVLGSEFGMSMKKGAGYKTRNKVVEYEPDRLIAWRHVGVHRWRYELEPTTAADGSEATTVTETWDLSPYNPVGRAALSALFGKATQQAIEATLVKRKDAAESDARG